MSGNTSRMNLPYPTGNETADVAGDIQRLAEVVDTAAETPAGAQAKVNTHEAKAVDPTSTETTRDKHVSNKDAKGWEDHKGAAAPHSGHETPAGAQAKVDIHAALTNPHSATSAATASRIMMRDGAGRSKVANPSASDDVATKGYVDAKWQKVYGNITYTDSIPANQYLTKNIPLGGNYNYGTAVISSQAGLDKDVGIKVDFCTDGSKTKMTGHSFYVTGSEFRGSAWTKRAWGVVAGSYTSGVTSTVEHGFLCTGNDYIGIMDIYISGTNLVIVFKNGNNTQAKSLNTAIDWEVW